MERGKLAERNFKDGCNCTQAVLLAFSDRTGLDAETVMRIASGFGGGMARMREVCGAVSGMFMAAGLILGDDGVPSHEHKRALYAQLQALAAQFRAENGSLLCRELLSGTRTAPGGVPEERTEQYYRKRPCAELCRCAAELLEQYLQATEKRE